MEIDYLESCGILSLASIEWTSSAKLFRTVRFFNTIDAFSLDICNASFG